MSHSIIHMLFLLCTLPLCGVAEEVGEADREVLRRFRRYAREQGLAELPVCGRVVPVARFFLGTPYRSGTLETGGAERPVVNLRTLDCVTFVENVLALACLQGYGERGEAAEREMEEAFVANLVRLRYRDARVGDYASRLHYSSDWLYEMQRQGVLEDVTASLGGVPYGKEVRFMSRHAGRYPALQADSTSQAKMAAVEDSINARAYHYLPKERVGEAYPLLREGDVLLMTTTIEGLDTSHLGIAVKRDGKVFLLHASSAGKRVMLSEKPLAEYLAGIPSQSGIMVARVTCLSCPSSR